LTGIVFRIKDGRPILTSFDEIKPDTQQRISYRIGSRYESLRIWLEEQAKSDRKEELDHVLSRLFGELLSQPSFGFYENLSGAEVVANLIESVKKFRWTMGDFLADEGIPVGKEYLGMILDGVIAAQYMRSWEEQSQEAVLLAPAYTFLMGNRPVAVQYWLDIGSHGWFERLNQPLTHPYVLSRNWQKSRKWGEADEIQTSSDALNRLINGLLSRCKDRVYLGLSELGEQGFESRGQLLQVFQRVLQRTARLISQDGLNG
jgi:hypothetical protein